MKFSSKVLKCELSPIRKFAPYAEAAEARGIKIYHLNIGQPDIKTPDEFFEAVRTFPDPVLAYSPSRGLPAYLRAVKNYYAKIGVSLETDEIFTTTGGSEALLGIMLTILDDGEEILVPEPYYPNYASFVGMSGASVVPIPTRPEEGYRYAEKEKIEALITDKTRAVLLSNPGNPTGCVLSGEEMRIIADIVKEHNLFLIADEVYREFTYSGEPLCSFGQFDDLDDNLIIVDSVSKRFSACGARIGAVISKNREFLKEFMKLVQMRLCAPTMEQYGAAALYNVSEDYFRSVREEYKRRRDTTLKKLSEIPGLVCNCPGGAFYFMVKLPVDNSESLLRFLLEEFEDNGETVMYAPGGGFYGGRKGFDECRMAYVLKEEDMVRAVDLLRMGIEAYKARGN